ncbi:MAG: D-2-hydroxyacid dehydrogenase [Armatimonadetes bacterium]|nr:D-2-hydroxyacid dehydrogenase [Armatimonadota bacterium]
MPDVIYGELTGPARELAPGADLRPYAEDEAAPVDGLDKADAVLRWVAGRRFSDLVARGPCVRWLHTASAGVDHVLTPAVRAKAGLTVTDSGPAFEIAISEFVLAWMLLVARRLPDLMAHQHAHEWKPEVQQELYGQTVGIIGLGPIGRGVASRAKAFGMRTLGLRRRDAPVPAVDEVLAGDAGLARLLRESDWIVLAAALTDASRSLIGPAQLAQMKPSAWLINIARGGLVDEAALTEALQAGRIGGACLDVFAREPLPPDSPLWDMPNVHIAPHNSPGWTPGLHERQKALFVDNLRRFVRGEPLEGVVDIAWGY